MNCNIVVWKLGTLMFSLLIQFTSDNVDMLKVITEKNVVVQPFLKTSENKRLY